MAAVALAGIVLPAFGFAAARHFGGFAGIFLWLGFVAGLVVGGAWPTG